MADRDRRGLQKFGTTLTSIVRALPWRSPALWLMVGVNVLLASLYFWSRGGQEIQIHVEAIGPRYVVAVDGRNVASGEFPNHSSGGVGFRLRPNDYISTVAGPVGIDSLKITHAGTDEILFEDDIGGSARDEWNVLAGDWRVDRGVLTTDTGGVIQVTDPAWRNYRVDATLRNVVEVNLYIWMRDTDSALRVDLPFFRGYRTLVQQWRGEEFVTSTTGQWIQLDQEQSIRSITAMMLRPYPTMLALVLITGALALGASFLKTHVFERRISAAGDQVLSAAPQLLLALCTFAFALLWYILFFVSDDMPHVPDSVLYVFQSKIFASFQLTAPAPPVRESFSIFHPPLDQVVDGRWFSHYPFGHPMLLAIGQLVRFPSIVPPLLGAGCIALIYFVGKRIYGMTVGLLAATLLLFSPFFQMTASNYMSHNSAAFVILACLAFYVWQPRRRWLAMLGTGLCFGLLFNIRPLPAFAFMLPLGALMAYDLIRANNDRRRRLVEYTGFAAGALVMFGLYLLYNLATTGDPFLSGYAEQGTFSEDTLGFGGVHTVAFGLQNQRQLLALMQLVAYGWPALVGFGIAALPLILGSRNRWDYFLGAGFLMLTWSNILYRNPAVMNGPRFWYESMPFLMLLTARGALYLRDATVDAAAWLHRQFSASPPAPARATTSLWVLAVITALVAFSASGWMLQTRQAWAGIPFTPARISELENFNFSDDRLLKRADDMDIHDALILVKKCTGWWCFGSEFWTNNPELDGDIVWAEQQGNLDDIALLRHYEDRKLYLADYNEGTIVPVSADDIIDQASGGRPAPGALP